ncbi:hypothetical protein BX600DRAFT_496715 [Xylariales sp. PMI_506]|nr:hypothetical protein BX600DRAFT_496715 [Xylariales sp. PMI_506]
MAPKILFLCNSDYGQANVYLATVYALMELDVPVELHIGAFEQMEGMVNETISMAAEKLRSPRRLIFHAIHGLSQFEAMIRPELGIMETWELPLPNRANTVKFLSKFVNGSIPWEADEFATIFDQTRSIIDNVEPDLTVVDCLFVPGLTLAHHLKLRWTILAPNTIKDFAAFQQPKLAGLWKYPVLGSALQFPISWSQVLTNIYFSLVLAYSAITSNRARIITENIRKHTGDSSLVLMTLAEVGVLTPPPQDVQVLVAMSEDLDYPFAAIPDYIKPLGLVVRPCDPIADTDEELHHWLSRGPTLYANLGTQLALTPTEALELALALKDTLDSADRVGYGADKKLQVLWKLMCKQEDPNEPRLERRESNSIEWEGDWIQVWNCLQSYIEAERVRITPWIEPNPSSILQSGHIICSLHHGGANSWAESTCAGVPHVVLPAWIDCYDFGNRTELANIGICANRKSAPRCERFELGDALKAVILGPDAQMFQDTAKRVAKLHPANAGRERAAQLIFNTLNKK